jgi:integrase
LSLDFWLKEVTMSVTSPRFSLYKRRDTQTFSIGYYVNGKRRWKSTGSTTKPEALKALTQFKELLRQRSASVLYSEFVTRFLAFAEADHAPKTIILYRAVLRSFADLVRGASLREITPETVDKFKAKRLKAVKNPKAEKPVTISPVSVNVELRALRAAFNVALRWGMIDSNPCNGVSLVCVPDVEPAYLRAEDFERLLQCIRENWLREVVLFAVLTGLRRGEILNLRWNDVDLARKLVQVQSSGTFRTKHGRRRTVPLNETALFVLNARHGKSASEYVFTLNDKPLNAGWVTHRFKKHVRRAGLNERLRFHSLRHTFATWLVQRGTDIYRVKELLGHADVKTTQVYSHLAASELHNAVNKISIVFN